MLRMSVRMFLLVATLIVVIRFIFITSAAESGWNFVATQWQDAALGFVGLGHTSIGHSVPAVQARFWLGEVDRVVDEYPNSASIHMGGAWVLDSPDIGFLENHIQQREFARAVPQMGLELDEDAISDAKAEFRDSCIESCLEMARRATQYDPTDVRWWRMRALLLFEGDTLYSGQEFEARDNNWLQILEECKKHDPENALYDYLAALQLWNESASYDWPDEPDGPSASDGWVEGTYEQNGNNESVNESKEQDEYWILTVHDAHGFALALQRFLEAQEKTFLAIGEAGYSSIAEFLVSPATQNRPLGAT